MQDTKSRVPDWALPTTQVEEYRRTKSEQYNSINAHVMQESTPVALT
jgi:hypothetical protein